MGVHYVNTDLVFDGKLDAEHPESLMYEMRDGRLDLLGVEYIVLVKAWHKSNKQPPTLNGQVFTYNGSPNRYGLDPFYALHVWAWRDNPHDLADERLPGHLAKKYNSSRVVPLGEDAFELLIRSDQDGTDVPVGHQAERREHRVAGRDGVNVGLATQHVSHRG